MKLGETCCVIAVTVKSQYKEEPEIWYLAKELNKDIYGWRGNLTTDIISFNSEADAITFYEENKDKIIGNLENIVDVLEITVQSLKPTYVLK